MQYFLYVGLRGFFYHENVTIPNEFSFFLNENCLLLDWLGIEDFINRFAKIEVVFECIFRIKDEFNSPGELKINECNASDLEFGKTWNKKKKYS